MALRTGENKMNEKELRQLINEVTAEIIAESPINPGDGKFTEEESSLLQQLQADAAADVTSYSSSTQSELDRLIKVYEKTGDPADLSAAETFEDENQNQLHQSPLDMSNAVSTSKDKMTFDEWLEDPKQSDSYDDWWTYVNEDDNDWYEQRHMDDQDLGLPVQESFQFEKFIKDINSREDKIAQHKEELSNSEDNDKKRELQKLYQEDWRNSTTFRGN
jgi:hypothetical protein